MQRCALSEGPCAAFPGRSTTWPDQRMCSWPQAELKQQQDKQQSLNALQSERRRQLEEKSQMQASLQAANNRASAAEGQRSALEQRGSQLQQELDSAKAQLAASQKALAECRVHQPDEPQEQVRGPHRQPSQGGGAFKHAECWPAHLAGCGHVQPSACMVLKPCCCAGSEG